MARRSTFALLGGLCLACLIPLAWEARTLVRLRRTEADRRSQRAILEQSILAARRSAQATKAGKSVHARASGSGLEPWSPLAAGSDPAAGVAGERERQRQQEHGGLAVAEELHWRLLLRQLKLPPDRAAQFLAIQTKLDAQKVDIYAKADANSVYHSDPAVVAQVDAAYAEADADQQALLGPREYAAYASYCQYNGSLALANRLTELLPPSDALTDDQVLGLTRVLGDASARDAHGYVIYGAVNWTAAEPQVQALLRPGQFSAYQTFAAQTAAETQQRLLEAVHHR